jgi:hypothetical protein
MMMMIAMMMTRPASRNPGSAPINEIYHDIAGLGCTGGVPKGTPMVIT